MPSLLSSFSLLCLSAFVHANDTYYLENVTTTYFVGSGTAQAASRPTISVEAIQRELFTDDAYKEPNWAIFNDRLNRSRIRYVDEQGALDQRAVIRAALEANAKHFKDLLREKSSNSSVEGERLMSDDIAGAVFRTDREWPVIVREPSKPFNVAGNLSIFWDAAFLPRVSEDRRKCQKVPTSNKGNVVFCDVDKMKTCEASPGPFLDRGPSPPNLLGSSRHQKVLIDAGKSVEKVAWLCPEGTHCCGWECCRTVTREVPRLKKALKKESEEISDRAENEDWLSNLPSPFAAALIATLLVSMCCMAPVARYVYLGARSRMHQRPGELELLPRPSDYPKQARSEPLIEDAAAIDRQNAENERLDATNRGGK